MAAEIDKCKFCEYGSMVRMEISTHTYKYISKHCGLHVKHRPYHGAKYHSLTYL